MNAESRGPQTMNIKYLLLGVIAWIIILGLIQEGLTQLQTEKAVLVGIPPARPGSSQPARFILGKRVERS